MIQRIKKKQRNGSIDPNRSGQKITNAYNLTYANVKMHVRKVNEKWNRIPESRKKA